MVAADTRTAVTFDVLAVAGPGARCAGRIMTRGCASRLLILSANGSFWKWVGGIGTGLMIAVGWGYTHLVSANSFQVVQVQGLTVSGPSAEWLMRVLSSPAPAIGFDFGLLPGVFLGSFIGAWIGKDLKLEGFANGDGMPRYIAGAFLMGFGSMLAGGCAVDAGVGAGITGGAIFALTAWLALVGMWSGAGLTDRLLDGKPVGQRMARPAMTAP